MPFNTVTKGIGREHPTQSRFDGAGFVDGYRVSASL
jgi:hypothetical protein